jgi:hypothetical protein
MTTAVMTAVMTAVTMIQANPTGTANPGNGPGVASGAMIHKDRP